MRRFGAKDPGLLPAVGDLGAARWWIRQTTATTAGDIEVKEMVGDFLDQHPDALWRTCMDGHLTGSAFVIDHRGERALLLHHVKIGRWLQPGGHADGDGNLAAVAWREATEETGIDGLTLLAPPVDLDVHRIEASRHEAAHVHLDLRFVAVAPEGAEPILNHEASDAAWFTYDEMQQWADPELSRLAERSFAAVEALADIPRR